MNPKVKGAVADCLGVGGFGVAIYGLFLVSLPLACIVAGIWMIVAAVLLARR